jgi:penicillin-binding protein 1B
VGVNVCRLSGKLPNTGCDAVEVVDDEGQAETRSMIYTEYFVRGTQPTQICPLHPGISVLGHIAGLFGKEGQPPASAEQLGLLAKRPAAPPAATPTTGHVDTTPPSAAAQKAEPKKKRGFWSRVFGLGRDDDKDKKDQPDSDQPQNATPQR